MLGQDAVREAGQPQVIELTSVPGFVVFDLPGAGFSAGGTRLAPDVTVAELALLARAMTYKYGALGAEVGGAKAGVAADPAGQAGRAGLMASFCAEIRPLIESERFVTGPDMGTFEEDFAPLRAGRPAPAAISAVIDGVPFEDLLTGYGVAVAAQTALSAAGAAGGTGGAGAAGPDSADGWAGRSVAIEGFGKVGGGVAREVVSRGGRVVAVSTVAGCLIDPAGLDLARLLELRREHGDGCVARYGLPVRRPAALFTAAGADVLVPGARPGVISRRVAAALPSSVRVIAPAANAPYTAAGAAVLHQRGITALADFVCNVGAVIGYRSDPDASPEQVLADAGRQIAEITADTLGHPAGPLAGACERAAAFVRGWWGEPPDPPFAPEPG